MSSLLSELTLDLPRVADLPPEPEWNGPHRQPDGPDGPSPSDVDDIDKQ